MKRKPELMAAGSRICGCDEAGRGPIAGPVVAAAVILPDGFYHPLLDDSKKMSEAAREQVREVIMREAVAWKVVSYTPAQIDETNILAASIAGMQEAVASLCLQFRQSGRDDLPEKLLIDGNRFRPFRSGYFYTLDPALERQLNAIPYETVVKGDGKWDCIAAASVLAKTFRDEYMRQIALEYPLYGWARNMGYPTQEHIEAIRQHGYSPYHRMSFHPKALEPTLF